MPSKRAKKEAFLLGPGMIALAALLWSLDGVLRRNLYSLPAINIVFFEHLIGLLLLLPIMVRVGWPRLSARVWKLSFIVAGLSGVLGTLWFTQALTATQFIPFSVVFLLQKLQPLFAITSATILLREQLPSRFFWWAGLALVAAFFVTFPLGSITWATGQGTIVAALLATGAAFAWGTSTTFSKLLLREIGSTQATFLRFALTTVLAGAGALLLSTAGTVAIPTVAQVGQLFLIALSTGMVALWVYYQGLRRTPASVSTIVELIFPLTAIFIDAWLYNTTLHWSQYAAAVVLVLAIQRTAQSQTVASANKAVQK